MPSGRDSDIEPCGVPGIYEGETSSTNKPPNKPLNQMNRTRVLEKHNPAGPTQPVCIQ